MLRSILGAVAGFVAWWIIVSLIDRGVLHLLWPAYAAADTPAMLFDLPMKIARLAESSIASVLAALVARRIAPASRYAVPAYGTLLLILFLPVHYMIWTKFPVWYHVYFLSSLVVLPLLTQWLSGRPASTAHAAAGSV
jgi:hypothetical protein